MSSLKNCFSFFLFLYVSIWSQCLLAQQNASDTVSTPIANTKYWENKSSFALNLSQVKLENWTGGGESSFSVGSQVHLEAVYSKGNAIWENRLDIAYGLLRQGDTDLREFRKTDDLLNVVTKYNYHLDEGFFITAIADYRTQMDDGFEFKKQNGETLKRRRSGFMAPGFLVSSLGATFKKPKLYSVTISPFTGKFTFVLDDSLSQAGAFGITPGETVRSEAGAALNSNYEKKIYTNINFKSSLNLFAGYESFSHVDVNWEGTLLLRVNQYIKTVIAAQLVYDHDIIQKTQWRNVINVGFLLEN